MILPTKHIAEDRSLIGQGGILLSILIHREQTVSSLWEEYLKKAEDNFEATFDWFLLALDLLYAIDAINYDRGVLKLRKKK